MVVQNRSPFVIIIIVVLLLLIPLISMQFTHEVNWDFADFIIAGALLLSTGFLINLVIRKINKVNHRIAVILIVLVLLFLIWAELAVGILGTPFSGS